MYTDPSQVLTVDEVLAADRLFAELLAERDVTSPVVDLAAHVAAVDVARAAAADTVAAAS